MNILRKIAVHIRTLSFRTPALLYAFHRSLFRSTNGRWNDCLTVVISALNRPYKSLPRDTSFFSYDANDIQKIVSTIDRDGYCILDQNLPSHVVAEIKKFSETSPANPTLPGNEYSQEITRAKESKLPFDFIGRAVRVTHPEEISLSNENIVKISSDPFFLEIAQNYLNAKPILDSVAMWWTFPIKEQERFSNTAAQLFHFDMDRIKFLKFFFYLTDVTSETGPHIYVKGSHKRLPKVFRARGRFKDSDVVQYYKDNIVEICAPKGSIIAVDTRGIHKGKIVTEGARLLLQTEYSNSLFGAPYNSAGIKNPLTQKHFADSPFADSFFPYLN